MYTRGSVMRRTAIVLSTLLATTPAFALTHFSGMYWFNRLSAHYGHAQMATWYGPGFYGRPVACPGYGRYTGRELTAAHRTLPCGSHVTVTNLMNHRTITVTITDRGPFTAAVIDLSPAARDALGAKSSIPVVLGVH
jgi:rare lipoprotein A